MKLERILENCGVLSVHGNTDTDILSVCSDSRKITEGALFVAVKGFASDGHDFIGKAVGNGASAVIYTSQEALDAQGGFMDGVTYVLVASSRHALAIAAANFYDNAFDFAGHKRTSLKCIEVLLGGEFMIGTLVIAGLGKHIRNHANRQQLQIPDGDAKLCHPQQEQCGCHFPFAAANFFLESATVSILTAHNSAMIGKIS